MVEINLLPAQYRRRSEPNIWMYASVAAGVVTLLAIAIPEIVVGTSVGNLQRRLDDQTGQISALGSVHSDYAALTTKKTELSAVSQTAQSLKQGKTYWSTDLARFVGQLPLGGDVALSSLTMQAPSTPSFYNGQPASKEFELNGSVRSPAALVNLLNAYDQDRYGVNFKSTQRDAQSGNYTFSATVGQLAGTPLSASSPVGSAAAPVASAAPAAPTTPPTGSQP